MARLSLRTDLVAGCRRKCADRHTTDVVIHSDAVSGRLQIPSLYVWRTVIF